ncbi:LAMI_0E08526g1_1 [Lachancea mirantina]|uniref:LAMI_0E08526g1_1 n=1 Tax=Lachancea mirantina TaxID=1230905 RepID=A0A1G4JMZ6_9SACH|nr:LAMI_0E08526g1_1 [Lachancea mirantina]
MSYSRSIILSNVPVHVSDAALLRHIKDGAGGSQVRVEHIQPFPDAYHYVNDALATKTLQLIMADEKSAAAAMALFENPTADSELAQTQARFHAGSEEATETGLGVEASTPRHMWKQSVGEMGGKPVLETVEAMQDVAEDGTVRRQRRISVTMI